MTTYFLLPFLLSGVLSAGPVQTTTPASPTSIEETASPSPKKNYDMYQLSEAFGHVVGRSVQSMGVDFHVDSLIKGLRDHSQGKPAPLGEKECLETLTEIRSQKMKKAAQKNLQTAEEFLKNNAHDPQVTSLKEGKVQYKITHAGRDGTSVSHESVPLVSYVGKFADGSVFSESPQPISFSFPDLLEGILVGMSGMKEGESRTIYIHPDLGYKDSDILPPNSLLIFDITVHSIPSEEKENPPTENTP